LLKLENDLDHAVQTPCDIVAIADVAEEIVFSLPGLQGMEEEKREAVSTVLLAIVDYAFTQGITAAGVYLLKLYRFEGLMRIFCCVFRCLTDGNPKNGIAAFYVRIAWQTREKWPLQRLTTGYPVKFE